jgi:hypothetical protein
MAQSSVLPLNLDSLAVILVLVAGLLVLPFVLRWGLRAVRYVGVLGGLGVVTVTLLAAILLFERK